MPNQKFDNIILGHVLEHVADPVNILVRAKQWLKSDSGRLFAAVPNSRSLHRQAAVIMGLLISEDALNEADIHHGHRRVFNPESFRNVFYQAGLHIEIFGGYWMKPVSNKQLEESWTSEMLDAFMQLGERYPDIAGEIYIVAKSIM
jgi:2-polyprenyl-3-methyl-5-hydroxy-6-metoxy-1,4-benzoquinol methylase